jgi:biotin transport system substrate-specific component
MHTYAKAETLTGAWLAPVDWVKSVALVVAFSLFIALSAQVVVPLPFTPMPRSRCRRSPFADGRALGSRLGALAVAAYLVEGAVGMPFFRAATAAGSISLQPDGRLSAGLPAGGVRHGLARGARLGQEIFDGGGGDALGSIVVLFGGWLGLLRFYPAGRRSRSASCRSSSATS